MSLHTIRCLGLTDLGLLPDVLHDAKESNIPCFLSSYGQIKWTVKSTDSIPKVGCSDARKLIDFWNEWKNYYGGHVELYNLRYIARSYHGRIPRVMNLTLHDLTRNARRVLDLMTVTADWDCPIVCYVSYRKEPLAIIKAGAGLI